MAAVVVVVVLTSAVTDGGPSGSSYRWLLLYPRERCEYGWL
jgi:hypothetical protein